MNKDFDHFFIYFILLFLRVGWVGEGGGGEEVGVGDKLES